MKAEQRDSMAQAQDFDAIAIPLSKNKLLLILVGSILFVAGGIWMWLNRHSQTRYHPLYVSTVGAFAAWFFGLCSAYGIFKLFDRTPGLVLDGEGIIDNSNATAVGRIYWDDIIGVRVVSLNRQRFVTIDVVDPQKYRKRGGFLRRTLNLGSAAMVGSPINISSNGLQISFDDLVELLVDACETFCAND